MAQVQEAKPYVETWKRIAAHIGRSERWCRYSANQPVDPLPVFYVGGMVRMETAAFNAWIDRRRAAGTGYR